MYTLHWLTTNINKESTLQTIVTLLLVLIVRTNFSEFSDN